MPSLRRKAMTDPKHAASATPECSGPQTDARVCPVHKKDVYPAAAPQTEQPEIKHGRELVALVESLRWAYHHACIDDEMTAGEQEDFDDLRQVAWNLLEKYKDFHCRAMSDTQVTFYDVLKRLADKDDRGLKYSPLDNITNMQVVHKG